MPGVRVTQHNHRRETGAPRGGCALRRIVVGAGAAGRLARAEWWLEGRRDGVLVIGATHDAARRLVRRAAARRGALFGWSATTLLHLAEAAAGPSLAARGLVPATPLAWEAVAARVAHRLQVEGRLGSWTRLAGRPGLARALGETLAELRAAGVARAPDPLGEALRVAEEELTRAGLADRAAVLAAAPVERCAALLLVDVPLDGAADAAFVARLAGAAEDALATVPAGDERTLARFKEAWPEATVETLAPESPAEKLAAALFVAEAAVPEAEVVVLSAPGESRECVELARRIRAEAARGVRFDEMAVLLRAPGVYRVHIAEALRRAGIPAHFAAGTRRPDPAGRAFLALLACAAERLSARRFAEYLSLGESAPIAASAPEPDGDGDEDPDPEAETEPVTPPSAPRRWERLLVEAAVIGGQDRWSRRLAGLMRAKELALAAAEDPADIEALTRARDELARLSAFALPLIGVLAELPSAATWDVWLDALAALARRALRRPERVLAVLGELAPMGSVGPVGLDEVRLVLGPRLSEAVVPPATHVPGRVLVASVDAVRGLAFEVVFVPGLAEKVFPPKLPGDPLLPDDARARLSPELTTAEHRVVAERLRLKLAAGAASRRLVASYPRLDVEQGRPRVPSLYALELTRASRGQLPAADELARTAEREGGAHLAWPAPHAPADAIDDAEHDLAVVRGSLSRPRRGVARYAVESNAALAAALRTRWLRRQRRWTRADGLVGGDVARAALVPHWLDARAFSATALQRFAACPYQFYLQAVQRLAPPDVAEAIEEIDPLARGSLVHEVLYRAHTAFAAAGLSPLSRARHDAARRLLDGIVDAVAARWRDDLAPAVPRVWEDGVAAVRADLGEWLRRACDEATWQPWRFELAFGLHEPEGDRGRDAASRVEPVALECGITLRGSIDLVERRADGALRATDFKTGRNRGKRWQVIAGGATLQPVLYPLALEKLEPGAQVVSGRLYFCTHAGGYAEIEVPLDHQARRAAGAVARTVGDALANAFFPAAPVPNACDTCDYTAVCGPGPALRERHAKPEHTPLVRLRLEK